MEKYDNARHPKLIESLGKLGADEEECSKAIGVDVATIRHWINKHEEFKDSYWRGRLMADMKVAESLYYQATGYEKAGSWHPPSTAATIFWLKNRRPNDWREKQPEAKADNKVVVTGGLPEPGTVPAIASESA